MSSQGGCSETTVSLRNEVQELLSENRLSEATGHLRRFVEEGSAEHMDYFCLIAAQWEDADEVSRLAAAAAKTLDDTVSACIPAAVARLRARGIGSEVDPSDILDAVFHLCHEVALGAARTRAHQCDEEIPDLWCVMFQFRDWFNIGADRDLLSRQSVGCTGIEWTEAGEVRGQPGMGILNNRLSWTDDGTFLVLSDVEDLDHPDLPPTGQFHAGYARRPVWLSASACHYTESRAGYRTASEQWLFVGGEFQEEGNFRMNRFFTTMPGVDAAEFARGAAKICLVPQVYSEYEVGGFRLNVREVRVSPPSLEVGENSAAFISSINNSGILEDDDKMVLRSNANPRHVAALITYFNAFGPGLKDVFNTYPPDAVDFFNRRAALLESVTKKYS